MSNIEIYIERAIQSIEAERDQKIADIKANIMVEVAPQNAEIDMARDEVLKERENKLNADIAALQEAYAKERQEVIDASEKKKTDNINMRIAAETASIHAEYNPKIAELKKLAEA